MHFFVFPSLWVLCRWCFLVFFFVFSLHPCGLPLIIYMYTHARGRGCSMGEGCGCKGGDIHTAGGSATAGGAGSWVLMVDPLRPSASSPLKRGQCRNAGDIIDEGRRCSMIHGGRGLILSARQGWRVLVVAPVVEGVPGEGPGHICGPNGPRCRHRARSVAAGFACEMGVFCGEVRLIFSVLGVFLAVEWGSKWDWCEDLLIFFRK